jgi:site-specific recombinase XerD
MINKNNSRRIIERFCFHFEEHKTIKKFKWRKLNRLITLNYKDFLVNLGISPNSIKTYLSPLKGIAREMWRLEMIDANEMFHIQDACKIKGSRLPRGRALPPNEILKLISYCENSGNSGTRNAAIISLTYGAGLRLYEVINLKIRDIKQDTIKIKGKGNRERLAYITPSIRLHLNNWLKIRGKQDGVLFYSFKRGDSPTFRPISRSGLGGIFKNLYEGCGLNKVTPHDMRRSFATNLLNAGTDIMTVKNLMGHADISTTCIYDMRGEESKISAAKQLTF